MMRWLLLLLFVSTGALAQPAAPPPAQARPAPARPDPARPDLARPGPPPAESIAEVGKPGWTVDERNGCWVWNPNPQIEEIVIWNGPCEGGPAQGDGLLEWRYTEAGEPRGERYVGSMARGRMHGVGTFLDAQGTVYQGEWQEGLETGLGLRVWVIGRYEGQWREGKRHGRGIMFWINGNLYRGEFRADLPEGLGEYFSVEGGWFRGTWLAGCFREGERQAAIGRPLEDCP